MLIDSKIIKNYILLAAIKRIGLLYKKKEYPSLLITILGDPIAYGEGIINLKTGPI